MTRPAGKLAVAMCVAAAGLISLPSARATSLDSFSARPAQFNPTVPSTRSYFQPHIAPGGSYRGRVILSNDASEPVTYDVDPVQGLTGVTSGSVYANRQSRPGGAARWVTPDVPEVQVPAHRTVRIGFTVRVPANTRPGDQLAGIAFENAHPPRSTGRFSITEIIRVVVGVEVRVKGPAHPQLALHGVALAPVGEAAAPSAVIHVADVGGLPCKPTLAVTLQGPHGIQTVTQHLDTLLPGDPIPYPLAWPRALASGRYSMVVHGSGCGPAVSDRATVQLGHPLTAAPVASHPAAATPATAGGLATTHGITWWELLLVGAGGLGLGLLVSRRRRGNTPPRSTG